MYTLQLSNHFSYYLALAGVSVLIAFIVWQKLKFQKPYPPGPIQRVFTGNLSDIPANGDEWEAYEELGKRYGSDVVYLNALGSHLLVLNSFEAAHDLLDKKGSIYSSRPRFVMINELWRWDWNLILMPYNKVFQAYRRVVQREFQSSIVTSNYRPVMVRETVALLTRLFETPEDLAKHLKRMAGAVIMMVTYGHQVTSADDEFIALAEAVREHEAKTPGSNLVDFFPILKYLPAWFPGGGFQLEARIARKLSMDMRSVPFMAVKKQIAAGLAQPSLVSRLLQDGSPLDDVDSDEFAMNCGGVVYSAGADTTVSSLLNFMLAITWYPEVQERAQRELDDVVGRDRLPTFDDRSRLPYVSNIVKESLRWKAVSPLGVPHATTESDEYRGWHIPKVTTVIANLDAMLHDESVYTNPYEFYPDRYMPTAGKPDGEPDPSRAAFGFGRRICPGRYFADDALYLAIATILHLFKTTNPTSSKTDVKWCSGLVSVPSQFPFKMSPRFSGARDLVSGPDDPQFRH